MALGILSTSTLPMPMLLDAIRHAETGHLSLQDARNARSKKGAIGPYQFLEKNLHNMGYRMPANIDPALVRDPNSGRALAEQYVSGYSNYHGFTTPLQKLAAYNMGPTAAESWLASGGRIEDLPQETQDYVRRAAEFLNKSKTQETEKMANTTFMSMPGEDDPNIAIDGTQLGQAARLLAQIRAENQVKQQPVTAPLLQMAMPSEDDAALNIDGTQVGDNSFVSALGQAMGNAVAGGANAQPQNQPMTYGPQQGDNFQEAILAQPMQAAPAAAAAPKIYRDQLSTQTSRPSVTQNRRDMSAMSMVPSPQEIGMNEMLIRMGAAGLGASEQGGLQALQAIGQTYGDIQDANRATGLAAYQAQMDAMASGESGKQAAENAERVSQIDQTLFDMDRALGYLEKDGMSLTGFFDSTFGAAWDNIVGNPEASARLLLKKLRVDDTLLRVAQTKGAISNKEMDLFMSPAPQDTQDEQVWIDWIKDRQVALRDIRRRLSTGETVGDRASSAQVDEFSQQGQGDIGLSQDDQSLVNKYL